MGKSISLRCTKCGYSKSFQLSIGMMYSPLSAFESSYDGKPLLESLVRSGKIKERAYSLLKEHSAVPEKYGHELYYCPHCYELCGRFYFRLATTAAPMSRSIHAPDANIRCTGQKP